MEILVLGSGAGGGFPQWNCNCANCHGIRSGNFHGKRRNQSSIAITDNGDEWILINASPDIRAQLANFNKLYPSGELRDCKIKSVMVVDAQIDHTYGLLLLREGNKLPVYCTDAVFEDLTHGLPILNVLEHYCGVDRHTIPVNQKTFSVEPAEELLFIAIPLVGKAPPYSPHRNDPVKGDNIALFITDNRSGRSLFYAPGLEVIDDEIRSYMKQSEVLLIDGTFWTEDEMIQQGVGTKKAHEMGHLPQHADNGMIKELEAFSNKRRILIHINNTNPILNEDSPEFQQLKSSGIEVAYDGMTIDI